ncbi:snRNA-activating protein complex subunit 5 isoform X1 [Sminthopsis crassicaudata]|uniref:snRNA-activating protein complex subunit 5 isoform X1 n=1 Tax=Sminthopsis crassicaudata TaxID=9301 RepID=UPI003D696107
MLRYSNGRWLDWETKTRSHRIWTEDIGWKVPFFSHLECFSPSSASAAASHFLGARSIEVEELALQSIISSREGEGMTHPSPPTKEPENILVQVDNETSINQTELQLSTRNHAQEEEEEEEEESDS